MGDLVDMLKLPSGQTAFPAQSVTVHPVTDPATGSPWQSREGADVLLLGDSFSNIYGAAEMGWGEAAGFPANWRGFSAGTWMLLSVTGPEQRERAANWRGGRPPSPGSASSSGNSPCAS